MPNPASNADVIARWRPLSAQETINADAFLGDAWSILKRRIADIEDRIADVETGEDFQAEVVRVICAAVLRVLKNPDGNVEEQIDDYKYKRDRVISSGELYFTDEEIDDLLVPGSGRQGRAYSIDMIADYDTRFAVE